MNTLTEEAVLKICASKARKGEFFYVHRFKSTRQRDRKLVMGLKKRGLLVQVRCPNPMLAFYRPEDEKVIATAQEKHEQEMKKIHAKNVDWYLAQALKHPESKGYYEREAENERLLSL